MIPSRLVFIWFGARFPYANLLALRSARRWFKPQEILLIVDDPDAVRQGLGECVAWPELRIERADASWFEGLPHVATLAHELFDAGLSPATKANLIRLAAMYKRGGVYLDFDTITVRDPAPLLEMSGFCGAEPVALPASLYASPFYARPFLWAGAGLRLAARELCARLPGGWRAFRVIEPLYAAAPNNAILGAEAGHPLIDLCFRMMTELPATERTKRFRLGTHLLQQATQRATTEGTLHGFNVLPPPHFFPLGPEISNHWFRPGTACHLDAMLRPETSIVHWYNSVEGRFLKEELTAEWVERHADTAFAEMVRRYF